MLIENNKENSKSSKFWSLWQINLAALLGSPFAGCYLISQNFKLLKLEKKGKGILIIGIIINLILLPIISFILEKFLPKFPSIVIPVAFASGCYQYAKITQISGIQKLKDMGVKRYSFLSWFWRCLILLLLGVILYAIGFAPVFLLP